jgi:hypothetical protein
VQISQLYAFVLSRPGEVGSEMEKGLTVGEKTEEYPTSIHFHFHHKTTRIYLSFSPFLTENARKELCLISPLNFFFDALLVFRSDQQQRRGRARDAAVRHDRRHLPSRQLAVAWTRHALGQVHRDREHRCDSQGSPQGEHEAVGLVSAHRWRAGTLHTHSVSEEWVAMREMHSELICHQT